MSMPDEMLHSRITRYHFLSGNRTAAETFRDLFGSAPFSVGILPKQIEVLATRLPGDTESNLDDLISTNTMFPAYRPFLGLGQGVENAPTGSSISGVARIPRREAAVHGKAKLCYTCVQQDLLETGYAYWHRSHHLPGVSVCWRHGESLMHACPKCSHPFFRKLRLLPNPTEPCICGWSALDPATGKQDTVLEKTFAEFAYELLQRNLPPMSCETLAASYVRQCRKRGFIHGKFVGTAKLFDRPKVGRKAQHRQKIATILAVRANVDLEYLWDNAYQATRWLAEHDNAWLMGKLSTPKRLPEVVEEVSDLRDSAYAAILLSGAENLYRISKGQKRVNLNNLQKLLPVRLPRCPKLRKRRFPLASQQAELLMESVWHFRLRRLIFALANMKRLNLPMNTGSLGMVSSVPNTVFQALVSFFEWDLEDFARNGVDAETLLKSTGLPRNWQGPPGFNQVLGGTAYYRNKSVAEST